MQKNWKDLNGIIHISMPNTMDVSGYVFCGINITDETKFDCTEEDTKNAATCATCREAVRVFRKFTLRKLK